MDVSGLNRAQVAAVQHGDGPLLVIAGAGSGKTHTVAHRVAALVRRGADPRRILLLTFSRRAAQELTRRVSRVLSHEVHLPWAGTFHAMANRLLRLHAQAVGLDPAFTLLDREDAADLMDQVRHERGLSATRERFPRKGTCLAIYSRVVNTQGTLRACLEAAFPFCSSFEAELRGLFAAFCEAKAARHLMDYDDLLLYWFHLMGDPGLAARVGGLFDNVLVDEYQDTNALQGEIVRRLRPDGRGVTVVGDDAQAIYGFRAANVRNILDFPRMYQPAATVLTLEQNYRSTQKILAAANAVIALAPERYAKELFSTRPAGERPRLVTLADEAAQADWVVRQVLERREQGVPLRQQAVLFRAAHHSDLLEVELGRRNVPFVKYGGLRFLEAAHVKDTLAFLRWAENPRDALAAYRVSQLLPGVGPAVAQKIWRALESGGFALARTLGDFAFPGAAADDGRTLAALYAQLCRPGAPWQGQMTLVRRTYQPHLQRLYEDARNRLGDLEQLEALAGAAPSREQFLSDLTLDPPGATGADAGPPSRDEDYLVLSTIHSAKGQEWDTVFVLNVVDGCIPSDLATGAAEEVEEERRLLYVAMTRAKNHLALLHPLRFYVHKQPRHGDRHVYAPRSRFVPDSVLGAFERHTPLTGEPHNDVAPGGAPVVDVAERLRAMWR